MRTSKRAYTKWKCTRDAQRVREKDEGMVRLANLMVDFRHHTVLSNTTVVVARGTFVICSIGAGVRKF